MIFLEGESFPLTIGQSSIWIAQALDRESPAYSMADFAEIHGEMESDALERAVLRTVEDSASLRLAFVESEDGPRQFFAPTGPWNLAFADFSATLDPEGAARAWMRDDLATPLDIHGGRLFRFALLRLSAEKHWFYSVNHHLINDAIGGRLISRRIAEVYRDLIAGNAPKAAELGSIHDILAREKAYQHSPRFARDREYCLSETAARPSAALAVNAVETSNAVEHADLPLDPDLHLEAFAKKLGVNAAAVFVAAVAAYLHRQTGATDLLIGFQTSARLGPAMRNAVGPTTNTTPLRLAFAPTDSFAELVASVARKMREALRHQQYRIEDLKRDLGLSPGDSNVFNAVVNFFPSDEPFSFTDQPCRRYLLGNWRVDDIIFASYDGGREDARRVHVVGNAAKYSGSAVRMHGERFRNLLSAGVRAPETACNALDRMTPLERRQVLFDFGGASGDEPHEAFVHRLFERQARTPLFARLKRIPELERVSRTRDAHFAVRTQHRNTPDILERNEQGSRLDFLGTEERGAALDLEFWKGLESFEKLGVRPRVHLGIGRAQRLGRGNRRRYGRGYW